MSKTIHSEQAPQFPLPFSHAVRAGDFVYVSGQVGVDPSTRETVSDEIEGQAKQCFRNVETILQSAGLTLDHVVKVDAHLTDIRNSAKFNEAYKDIFSKPYPARTTVQSGLPPSFLIEVDVVAYAPSPRGE